MLNWGRHTVGTIPFVWIGGALYGAPGVLIGQAAGGVLFGVAAILIVRGVIRSVEEHHEKPREPGLFQRQARQVILFFSRR